MRIKAALLVTPNRELEVDDVELDEPRSDEVLVRLHASGVCRSDLSIIDGTWPAPLPIVLGHEGAGVIEAVGPGVDVARVGQHVVLTFAPPCGRCRFCLEGRANLCVLAATCFERGSLADGTTRMRWKGRTVHHLASVSSFATHAVVPAAGAIPIIEDLDLSLACLLGCGVTTGVMSVTNRAGVRPGQSVAVFGCGGVGLSAIQGARLVSAYPIVAIDPLAGKRELARTMGATHVVDPTAVAADEAIRSIVPGGVDYAFEALGSPPVISTAFSAVRDGGCTVLIGQPAMGINASFPIYDVTQFEHRILGSNLGGANPLLHVPPLAVLAQRGLLDLDRLVTHRYSLADTNEAIDMARSGEAGRVVIDLIDGQGAGHS
jgi:S-(hydroxymethyl)glutathione dehydrogenase/alcohol dehydrogenase